MFALGKKSFLVKNKFFFTKIVIFESQSMLLKNVFFVGIGHLKWPISYFVTINALALLHRFQVTWLSSVGGMGHFIFYFRASTFIDIIFLIFTASFFVTHRRLKNSSYVMLSELLSDISGVLEYP